jgi:hypothetical protein
VADVIELAARRTDRSPLMRTWQQLGQLAKEYRSANAAQIDAAAGSL